MTRRVVVTGLGMTTPLGVTTDESWKALVAGKSGIRTVQRWIDADYAGHKLPVSIAGEVPDFDPEPWLEHKKDVKRMDRFILLAMCAGHQAWTMAGLPPTLENDVGD